MKKLLALLLILLSLLNLAACGESTPADTEVPEAGSEMPTVLNQDEYVLYQNIFFKDRADEYLGKSRSVEGTLARLYDAFSQKTRYYVWGYMDATKCCDWQWEFVPQDPDSLPANGSLVKMTGVVTRDDAALDKIWFTDARVELQQVYEPEPCDVDMTVMSATLERVQLLNMQYKPEAFAGKSLRIYGRVYGLDAIQHPYYDNAWTQKLEAKEELPAIGTMVIVAGSWQGDKIRAERTEPTNAY